MANDSNVINNRFMSNKYVELLSLCGGLSILLFPFLYLFSGARLTPAAASLAFTLSFVVNYPHFAATAYRLYHNEANRKNYPFTVYYFPLIMLAVFGLTLCFPQTLGSYYCKFFFYWSGYHYSGQTLGITLIYARRNQIQVTPWSRRISSPVWNRIRFGWISRWETQRWVNSRLTSSSSLPLIFWT